MNLLAALDRALRDLHNPTTDDHIAVHTALRLALAAWERCDCPDHAIAAWDLFGTDIHAAVTDLYPGTEPVTVAVDPELLPDTAAVRDRLTGLASAAAARLDALAGDPDADPDQRWTWSTAAARLRRAAAELTAPR